MSRTSAHPYGTLGGSDPAFPLPWRQREPEAGWTEAQKTEHLSERSFVTRKRWLPPGSLARSLFSFLLRPSWLVVWGEGGNAWGKEGPWEGLDELWHIKKPFFFHESSEFSEWICYPVYIHKPKLVMPNHFLLSSPLIRVQNEWKFKWFEILDLA